MHVSKSEQVNETIINNVTAVSTVSGIELYNNACASCHQASGAGLLDQYYPSLLHNSTVGNIYPNNLVMVILNGVRKKIDKTTTVMPGFAEEMNDTQIAAVANYVLQHYGNKEAQVTPQLVSDLRSGSTNNSAAPLLILFWGGVIIVLLIILMVIWRVTKNW